MGGHGSHEQRTAAHHCTAEGSPAVLGCRRVRPGGIHPTLPLTQDVEVQATPVRASRAGCHAEVMAQILHLDRVNLQRATWQELQSEQGEQVNAVGALHGQAASHREQGLGR